MGVVLLNKCGGAFLLGFLVVVVVGVLLVVQAVVLVVVSEGIEGSS